MCSSRCAEIKRKAVATPLCYVTFGARGQFNGPLKLRKKLDRREQFAIAVS